MNNKKENGIDDDVDMKVVDNGSGWRWWREEDSDYNKEEENDK